MASLPPSSFQSEPAGPLYSGYGQNSSYTSLYDTSIDNTSPDAIPPASSAIFIEKPTGQSNETPFDNYQGYSAPNLPVYINMGANDHGDDVNFAGTSPRTPDPPLSRSLASIDVDHPLPSASQRQSHHHHHYPHHSQNRNRYPYLQRQISTRALNGTQVPRTSLEGLPYYEQRPAFRRSYFALRRQRIPRGIKKINKKKIFLLKIFS
jgi:hypothetical protein